MVAIEMILNLMDTFINDEKVDPKIRYEYTCQMMDIFAKLVEEDINVCEDRK